jgi:ribonuclease J
MTHSIPDACAVAVATDLGTVLVTGDYKFDQTPVGGAPADMARLAELGREGLLLLCGDSTNVDRAGISDSESIVGPHLERLFARCAGRIVVTCFASNIHRVQQVVHAAAANDRKVALVGRSMRKNVNIGRSLGHIDIPEGMLVPPRELDQWPDSKIVVISTGSQGEPLSALRRMAYRDHPQVELREGDTVIFSATPIPGNERSVNETIDRLYHVGCEVVTARDAPIHASGHGYAEEVKMMLNLTRPRYVMPVHGDFKRMLVHSQLAEAVGVPGECVFRLRAGRLVGRPARGAGPRRAVPDRRRHVHPRAARSGRGLAGPGRRPANHRGRRAGELPARRPGDVHLRQAQAPSDGAAGRRRGVSETCGSRRTPRS